MLIIAMLRRVHLFCLGFAASASCLILAGLLAAQAPTNGNAVGATAADKTVVENYPIRLAAGTEFR